MTRPGFRQCPWCPEDFMHFHHLSFHVKIMHPEKSEDWVKDQREQFIREHGGGVRIPPMQADLGVF